MLFVSETMMQVDLNVPRALSILGFVFRLAAVKVKKWLSICYIFRWDYITTGFSQSLL